jgi:hypothetical protein
MPASWKPELDAKVNAHFSVVKGGAKSRRVSD